MKNKKLCCRIFPFVLILISTVFALAIWYFSQSPPEGTLLEDALANKGFHSFSFLKSKDGIFNFIGTILFIAIIPIGIFYYLNDKEKYKSKARLISLAGFLPVILVLLFILF